ncbi:MAG: tail fiber domain-containing protein [Planctomycetota bacterium]
MPKRRLLSHHVTVVVWGLMVVLGVSSVASAADETVTGNLTIQSAFPKLIFDNNDGSPYMWQILPDDVSFEIGDVTATTAPFKILHGAPTNSFVISSDGEIGLGTNSPLTSLHIKTDNLNPTLRLESTELGIIWDLRAANDFELFGSGFMGGSSPLRIKNSAPTDSLYVHFTGQVGMGTGTPDANSRLDIRSTLLNGLLMKRAEANQAHYLRVETNSGIFRSGVQGNGDAQFGALTSGKGLNLLAGGTTKLLMNSSGQISFGNAPLAITTHALVHQTGARLTNVGVWANASSRDLKQDIEPITSAQARDTVRALQPVGYRYKSEPQERYVGFIAEDVPELVALQDRKSLAPMDFVAVLTKVVQDQDLQLVGERQRNDQQQKLIEQQQEALKLLSRQVAELKQMIGDGRDQAK